MRDQFKPENKMCEKDFPEIIHAFFNEYFMKYLISTENLSNEILFQFLIFNDIEFATYLRF